MVAKAQTTSSQSWLRRCVILFTLALPFGYLPVINLGQWSGVQLELSLAQLSAALMIVTALPLLYRQRRGLLGWWLVRLSALVATWQVLTAWLGMDIIHSLPFVAYQAALLLVVVVVAASVRWRVIKPEELLRLYVIAVLITCGFAIYQVINDALGGQAAGLRPLFNGSVFGFGRPHAFMLEPQFLGSLLVPAIFFRLSSTLKHARLLDWQLVLLGSTLLLTLSRGAFLALLAGGLVWLWLQRPSYQDALKRLLPSAALALVLALTVVGWAAHIRPDTQTASSATRRYLEHASLGLLDLNEERYRQKVASATPSQPAKGGDTVGTIESSSNDRLTTSERALQATFEEPQRLLFGLGSGGFGLWSVEQQVTESSRVIVNNQYIELLAETGLIGLLLWLSLFMLPLVWLPRRGPLAQALIAGLIGVLVQYGFFSGQANVVHIWWLLGVAYGYSLLKKKRVGHGS